MGNQPIDTDVKAKREVKKETIEITQSFTVDWATYGSKINVDGYENLKLKFKITGANSENMRFRLRDYLDSTDTDIYREQILTVAETVATAEPDYIESNTDGAHNPIFPFNLNHMNSYVQIEIQAGTAGTPASEVVKCTVVKG